MTKLDKIQKHLDNLSELAQESTLHYEDGTQFNIYDLKELMAKELTAIEDIQKEEEKVKKRAIHDIALEYLGIEHWVEHATEEVNYYELHKKDIKKALELAYEDGQATAPEQAFKEFEHEADDDKPKETELTVDELIRMGDKLSDVHDTIELYNHSLNLTPAPNRIKQGEGIVHYHALHELASTMFYKNQKMMKEIDNIAYLLQENAEAFEIKDIRKKLV